MDLHHLHTYIRPRQLEDLTAWDPGWNWLAGGLGSSPSRNPTCGDWSICILWAG